MGGGVTRGEVLQGVLQGTLPVGAAAPRCAARAATAAASLQGTPPDRAPQLSTSELKLPL